MSHKRFARLETLVEKSGRIMQVRAYELGTTWVSDTANMAKRDRAFEIARQRHLGLVHAMMG